MGTDDSKTTFWKTHTLSFLEPFLGELIHRTSLTHSDTLLFAPHLTIVTPSVDHIRLLTAQFSTRKQNYGFFLLKRSASRRDVNSNWDDIGSMKVKFIFVNAVAVDLTLKHSSLNLYYLKLKCCNRNNVQNLRWEKAEATLVHRIWDRIGIAVKIQTNLLGFEDTWLPHLQISLKV